MKQKGFGNIGIAILLDMAATTLELLEYVSARATRPRANLENFNTRRRVLCASFVNQGSNGSRDERIKISANTLAIVNVLDNSQRGAGKQDVGGSPLSAQYIGQCS